MPSDLNADVFVSPRTEGHPSGAQHEPSDPQRICPVSLRENFPVEYQIAGVNMRMFRHPESGLPCDCKEKPHA